MSVHFNSSVEPLQYLGFTLPIVRLWATAAERWATRRVPMPLLNPRNDRQFNLVEWVRASTGKPHYGEVAELLCAGYHSGIQEKNLPTADSLKVLVSKFKKNREAWRASRARANSTSSSSFRTT